MKQVAVKPMTTELSYVSEARFLLIQWMPLYQIGLKCVLSDGTLPQISYAWFIVFLIPVEMQRTKTDIELICNFF